MASSYETTRIQEVAMDSFIEHLFLLDTALQIGDPEKKTVNSYFHGIQCWETGNK